MKTWECLMRTGKRENQKEIKKKREKKREWKNREKKGVDRGRKRKRQRDGDDMKTAGQEKNYSTTILTKWENDVE